MFNKWRKTNNRPTRVLVCTLGDSFRTMRDSDAAAYRRWYKCVDIAAFDTVSELLAATRLGNDIIHLSASLGPGGWLSASDARVLGTDLIAKCSEQQVKLLWIASENKPDDYVSGFRAAGKRLNLVMTLDRNGESFTSFLNELLSRISQGARLPNAWAAMAPQVPGSVRPGQPGCIFFAGWPDASFR